MDKWRNFYLQKMDGSNNPVKESVAAWGIYCKDIPFKILDKVKAPAKRSWNDEHGDDEYIPSDGLFLEAYTMIVELGCKKMETPTSVSDVRVNIGKFLKYLRESGHLKMYSSHTRIGRQNVRLESVSDDAKWKSDDGEEYLIFKVTFKVNDPVTDIKPTINNDNLVKDE